MRWTRFIPPLVLMVVIFVASSRHGGGEIPGWEVALRKAGHAVGYGLLWVLWWRALGRHRVAVIAAAAITVVYAISDEIHQTFVPGRTGTPRDVAIDAAGMLVAMGAVAVTRRRAAAPTRPSRAPRRS